MAVAAISFRNFKSTSGTRIVNCASAPLLPKFVSKGAATYHELRKRGHWMRDLSNDLRWLAINSATIKSWPLQQQIEGDRKSTRLNSSHLGISYAVFCLTKKRPRPLF